MILCDASALVPLFVYEEGTAIMEAFFQNAPGPIVVSDFATGEVASAVSRTFARRLITAELAERAIKDFDTWAALRSRRSVTEPDDIALAAGLVRRFALGLRMPDAIYLAQALRSRMALLTRDRRQASGARTLGIEVVPLSST